MSYLIYTEFCKSGRRGVTGSQAHHPAQSPVPLKVENSCAALRHRGCDIAEFGWKSCVTADSDEFAAHRVDQLAGIGQ